VIDVHVERTRRKQSALVCDEADDATGTRQETARGGEKGHASESFS
jgi:hypothetical protein